MPCPCRPNVTARAAGYHSLLIGRWLEAGSERTFQRDLLASWREEEGRVGREIGGGAGGRTRIWLSGFPAPSYLASLCLGLLICELGMPGVVGSLHGSSRWPPLPGIHTLCPPSHTGSTGLCDHEKTAKSPKDSGFHFDLSLPTPGL